MCVLYMCVYTIMCHCKRKYYADKAAINKLHKSYRTGSLAQINLEYTNKFFNCELYEFRTKLTC